MKKGEIRKKSRPTQVALDINRIQFIFTLLINSYSLIENVLFVKLPSSYYSPQLSNDASRPIYMPKGYL